MSFGETFVSVSPTGSTQLRTITGSAGRHIEVIASTDQNLNIIFPNQINITGSITVPISGSTISNTQPVNITGSITQSGIWNINVLGDIGVTGSSGTPFDNIIRPISGSSAGPPVIVT